MQIFRELELPAERDRIKDLRDNVEQKRNVFVSAIVNNTDVRNLDKLVSVELARYEKVCFVYTNNKNKRKNWMKRKANIDVESVNSRAYSIKCNIIFIVFLGRARCGPRWSFTVGRSKFSIGSWEMEHISSSVFFINSINNNW